MSFGGVMSKLAINGGVPVKSNPFPEWPQYDDGERRALLDVLESRNWWRTPGEKTKNFEEEFASFQGARYGIACTNGTAALEITLCALGIGLGDEVIIPDFTFVATASAILQQGAMPVMVDIDPETYNIDPDKIEAAISPRTKAIIVVHIGGNPASLDRIVKLTEKYKLFLIEDSAHAHGSEWNHKKVGNFGIAGTFSFQQSKLLTAGEGGIIITNDDDLEVLIRSVHDCGRMPGEWFYAHFNNGSNYRLSEWQGAILREQLKRLDEQSQIRTKNAQLLDQTLSQIPGIRPQKQETSCTCNGHYCYIFHYDSTEFNGLSTEKFIGALNAEGVPTQASYPPIHALALFTSGAYKKRLLPVHCEEEFSFLEEEFPVTQDAAENTVWLVHRTLLGNQQDTQEIANAIIKIQENVDEIL